MAGWEFDAGVVVTSDVYGKIVRFFAANFADTIQNYHISGKFFEIEELIAIYHQFPKGGVYLDIGANVGNHAVYMGVSELTDKIIVIEPNPEAIRILTLNLLLNELNFVDKSFLGVGLSDVETTARMAQHHINNLGEAGVIEDPAGSIKLVTGDSLFAGRQIDFIKIDVEGHEMRVLAGLEQTIARNRPKMFIEVDDSNRAAFDAWVESHRYELIKAFRRRPNNENFLMQPVDTTAGG